MKKTWVERQNISLSILICLALLLGFGSRTVAAQNDLEVEPGLKIPNAKTPWAVDVFENKRQLVPLHSTLAVVNRFTAANTKLATEVDGLNSKNQFHSNRPALYVNQSLYDFFISRVEQKKEERIIDQLALTQLKENAERTAESFVETKTTEMGNGWIRIEPIASMPEGEYVLLAKTKDATNSPIVVWLDFGIHGNSPHVKDVLPTANQL